MPTYLVELEQPLPAALGEELAKRVYYIAADIESFAMVALGDVVTGVEITTAGEADLAGLTRKVEHVCRTEVRPQRMVTAQPVWTSPHGPSPATGVFEELKRLGAVHEMGPGSIATGQLFTEVLDALDARVRRIAVEKFGAIPFRYPTLISTEALTRGGYLRSFPQYVMTAARLHTDLDVYREFVDGLDAHTEAAELIAKHSEHTGFCLPPTMCFHTYQQLSGRPLDHSPSVYTARGRSFRFETHYSRSLERLWDFTIREIVFVGEAGAIVKMRQDFLDAACDLVTELGLAGHVEAANDPFFADAAVPQRVLAQRVRKLKYELRMPAEEGRSISVASFNVHGTTFGEPYAITLPNGEIAHTACAGFGLERLAFAFFCQHGTDRRHWPNMQ